MPKSKAQAISSYTLPFGKQVAQRTGELSASQRHEASSSQASSRVQQRLFANEGHSLGREAQLH